MTRGLKHRKMLVALAGLAAAAAVGLAARLVTNRPGPRTALSDQTLPQNVRPRVLFVDSFHDGYPWSDGVTQGVLKVLRVSRAPDGALDDRASGVQLRIVRMDTKRNPSEEFKVEAGRKVKEFVDSWKPAVVICSDDIAAAYVIVPYFRNTDLPVVFCGVNWDASGYGLPCRNVTGMLQVSMVPNLLKTMRAHARGERLGLLGAKNETNLKEAQAYAAKFKLQLSQTVFVESFVEWKAAYLDLQDNVDMLILAPPPFLTEGPSARRQQAEARRLVLASTRIPTGSVEDWIAPYSLVCFAKKASEQGEWAAKAALQILSGKPPGQIPVTANRVASVYLNMALAAKLGVRFPVDLIERSTLLCEDKDGAEGTDDTR